VTDLLGLLLGLGQSLSPDLSPIASRATQEPMVNLVSAAVRKTIAERLPPVALKNRLRRQ
jgi:hypothetical protein